MFALRPRDTVVGAARRIRSVADTPGNATEPLHVIVCGADPFFGSYHHGF